MTRSRARRQWLLPFLLALALSPSLATPPARADDAAPNTLTPAEKRAGWKLLFDGKTSQGWRGLNRQSFPPSGWRVENGTLLRIALAAECEHPGDIITTDEYESFEFRFDWKLTSGGNSGIKYFVDESKTDSKGPSGHSGLGYEYQLLDDEHHADAKAGVGGNHTAGALYDLIAPSKPAARSIGEWNESRLLVDGNHVEQWLNGEKVVSYERGTPELAALLAKSKYKDFAWFGTITKGHLLLQDHNSEAAFRNLKLRPLKKARAVAAKP